jgi:hypothetical protein
LSEIINDSSTSKIFKTPNSLMIMITKTLV